MTTQQLTPVDQLEHQLMSVQEAETTDELQQLWEGEITDAKAAGLISEKQYRPELREVLNERYRVINKMEPA